MALNEVKEYLKKYNADDRVVVLNESSATVSMAAHALHTTEERIAKTLSFKIDDKVILVVLAGDAKINNSKFKHFFHEKAHMLPFDEVESLTGHPVGGVCPFAVKPGVEVYLDESLKRFETVFPACGSPASAIEVTIKELEEFSNPVGWTDVSTI
jgi:prolyl-tRNA editing enzyme YbaK/EbsC (Cys-tRNA(Pro) deacylase)